VLIFRIAYFEATAVPVPASDYEAAAVAFCGKVCATLLGHYDDVFFGAHECSSDWLGLHSSCLFWGHHVCQQNIIPLPEPKCENVFLRCTFDCCLNWSATQKNSDKVEHTKNIAIHRNDYL